MKLIASICLCFVINLSYAGIMPESSRLVYNEGDREKGLMLVNTNDYPVIVQNWVDNGVGDPESNSAPFVSLPSIFRMEPNGLQGLRIIYNQSTFPTDREAVFWLNLYEIPPEKNTANNDSRLLLTMNTQLKIFYRPKSVTITPEEAITKLKFVLVHEGKEWIIKCHNPTPIHISFTSLSIINASKKVKNSQQFDMMVNPFSTKDYPLDGFIINGNKTVNFTYLDDNGVQINGESTIQP